MRCRRRKKSYGNRINTILIGGKGEKGGALASSITRKGKKEKVGRKKGRRMHLLYSSERKKGGKGS